MSERVLLVGATSGIGRAIARELAASGSDLVLAGRRLDEIDRIAADLEIRHRVRARVVPFDALDFDAHPGFFEKCAAQFGEGLDGVILCQGDMPEQAAAEADFALARNMIDVNYTASVSLLNCAAGYLEARGRGWVAAVTSVAGDRGRRSNFLYGSTKAALSTYLEGLHARLAAVGVGCTDVRPGTVDTSMTYGMESLPLPSSPEAVARGAVRAIRRRKRVAYVPWFWGVIMLAIRWIPTAIFRRLSI